MNQLISFLANLATIAGTILAFAFAFGFLKNLNLGTVWIFKKI